MANRLTDNQYNDLAHILASCDWLFSDDAISSGIEACQTVDPLDAYIDQQISSCLSHDGQNEMDQSILSSTDPFSLTAEDITILDCVELNDENIEQELDLLMTGDVEYMTIKEEPFDAQNDTSSDSATSTATVQLLPENYKLCGWEFSDNKALERLVDGELAKVGGNKKLLNWAEITRMFNEQYGQDRTKVQVYSHFRNYTKEKNNPCYTSAEEEALKALVELQMPVGQIARLIPNNRSAKQVAKKLQEIMCKSTEANQPEEDELKRRAKFRERVKHVVLESGWLCDESSVSDELINRMHILLTIDPKLLRNSHPIGVGRPKKAKVFNNSAYDELAALLRPFTYVNNRRKRTTGLHGDGRRYGLNIFALYRLLGATFDKDKLPAENDEDALIHSGVQKLDHKTFIQFRKLTEKLDEQKSMIDHMVYTQDPEKVPPSGLLPPTLFTLTGLRGLWLYRENLRETAAREETDYSNDNKRKLDDSTACSSKNKRVRFDVDERDTEQKMQEADKRLERTLESLFHHSWQLISTRTPNDENLENSAGETDSDEELVWIEPEDLDPNEEET